MSLGHGASIVRNGLIACLDPANTKSYPGTGTVIKDLSGRGANGTINGTIGFVNNGPASSWNFATRSDSNYINSSLAQTYLDCTIAFQPDFAVSDIVGLLATSPSSPAYDDSLRFTGNPWSLAGRNPGDLNDWAYPTATTYYINGKASNVTVSGWNILGGYRTNQTTFNSGNSFSYVLGSSGYPNRGFQGKLGVVLLYNRQLTAAEQIQNFEALRGRYGI